VRTGAFAILQGQGRQPGFTSDQTSYGQIVQSENSALNWVGNSTLQFTYNTTDGDDLGIAQVNAVLEALAQKDHDLDLARDQASREYAASKVALDQSRAKVEEIKKHRREMEDLVDGGPRAATVAKANEEAKRLNQAWLDAKTLRQNTEKVLADLRSQDPSKPIDIDGDPQVVELKKQLQPLLDQIAKLKGVSSVDPGSAVVAGTNVSAGASTQPDANANPLLAQVQQQVDLLSKRLNDRRDELAAQAAIDPAQRAVNQATAIENLSVKITDLQKAEDDAKAAADKASDEANKYNAQVAQATAAGLLAQGLQADQTAAENEAARIANDSEEKEAVLRHCVTVKSSRQPVRAVSTTDLRPKVAIAGSVISCVFLGLLLWGESRRPKLITSLPPEAAPRVNPPVRLIPWPQPRELAGLENGGKNQTADHPEQMLGV